MGDSSQTQTSQTQGTQSAAQNASTGSSKDPWAAAIPSLQGIIGQASNLNQSTTNPALGGALTVGQSQAIANAQGGMTTGLANQGGGALSNLFRNGGLTSQQQQALSGINSSLAGYNAGNAQTNAELQNYASGSQIGQNNPAFSAALNNAMQQSANTINSQFAGAGRYGSGAQTDALSNSLGNIATQAYSNQYNQDVASQLSAIGQLNGQNNASLSGNLSGQSAASGIGQQSIANQLAGIGSIGTVGTAQNMDAQNLQNVGAQGWSNLGNYASIINQIAGLGGSSSGFSNGTSSGSSNSNGTSTTQNDPSLFGSLTAGLGGGLNLLKGLGSIGLL